MYWGTPHSTPQCWFWALFAVVCWRSIMTRSWPAINGSARALWTRSAWTTGSCSRVSEPNALDHFTQYATVLSSGCFKKSANKCRWQRRRDRPRPSRPLRVRRWQAAIALLSALAQSHDPPHSSSNRIFAPRCQPHGTPLTCSHTHQHPQTPLLGMVPALIGCRFVRLMPDGLHSKTLNALRLAALIMSHEIALNVQDAINVHLKSKQTCPETHSSPAPSLYPTTNHACSPLPPQRSPVSAPTSLCMCLLVATHALAIGTPWPLERLRTWHAALAHHTIPYHTIPYHTTPHHTIPCHTTPYRTIPHHPFQSLSIPTPFHPIPS